MKSIPSPATITRFNLGSLPLGFHSATPWAQSGPASPPSAPPATGTAPAASAATPRSTGHGSAVNWVRVAVFALLALHATLAWTASLGKGQSFDEGLHLAVGYNLWLNDDFRMEGANGDFVKRWATLPYLISRPHFLSAEDKFWRDGASYEVAHRFFFS
jgi:hypothetical protein